MSLDTMSRCMKCGEMLPDGAKFCMECGCRLESSDSAEMHEVISSKSEIRQSTDPGGAKMHDVIAHRSKLSQETTGKGSNMLHHVSGDQSQFGQASVGSIHIGDRKRTCPICGNYISERNASLRCGCGIYFCEKCESYFRGVERLRGEKPLCETCFNKKRKVSTTSHPKAGQVWISPTGMQMVFIPAGTFFMGKSEDSNSQVHEVTISKPFYPGKYPVTHKEWKSIMGSNPSRFKSTVVSEELAEKLNVTLMGKDPLDSKGYNRPVDQISWNDCQEFIRRLNAREGMNTYRLPTEAEWEFACRAGSNTRYHFGDGDQILWHYAWFGDNSGNKTHPVGQKNPNKWGLYDMYGNVLEWCSDWYGNYPTGHIFDPEGSRNGSHKVVRGGSWHDFSRCCTSTFRNAFHPGSRYDVVGLRIARTL